jgi:CYTH domain-containing protein
MSFDDTVDGDTNDTLIEDEIERKWFLESEPPQNQLKEIIHIQESYASINPVVRVRRVTEKDQDPRFFHAVKYRIQGDMDRFKIKTEISEDDYNKIFKWIGKEPVEKDRYIYDIGNNLEAKVDKFSTGQNIVEIEFPSMDVLKNFVAPKWFGKPIDKNISISEQSFRRLNGMSEDEKTIFSYSKIDTEALWSK